MTNPEIKFKKLFVDVKLPSYMKEHDVGMDIYSREHRTLEQGEPYMFKTGFSTEFSEGWVAMICDRSSVGFKGVKVMGGIIDPGYRGEWGVVLTNLTRKEIVIRPGDRIAQILMLPVAHAIISEVKELSNSDRSSGGFGSTGR